MTTIHAAAAWHVHKRCALAALAAILSAGLAGCETAGNLLGTSGDSASSQSLAPAQQQSQAVAAGPKVAVAPVIGAPDGIAKQLSSQVADAGEKNRVTFAKGAGESAEYTLRGYVVAAREKTGTKVSYIWDVTDPTGKRVHRITGEEIAPGGDARDPWSAVSPQIVQTIANKTASSLAAWLPSQAAVVGGAGAPAGVGAAQQSAIPVAEQQAAPAASRQQVAAADPGQATGSIGREGEVSAIVPTVSGAPGDGSVALTSAIQRELTRSGISLTEKPGANAYRVEGKVTMGAANDGKQPIQIDWNVKDPKGKRLGTVSQKNEIPQGSLDQAWGKTADAAAAAAAQGILKLLPQSKATSTN